ncbi:MAG: response regulator transcription factor [Arcobacteraceae bacterium]|nr:response regulator transcription factor [Arcobacteraceae bacterium]
MIKILLLEDDELFADTLIDILEEYDYEVKHCIDGEKFLAQAYEEYFDIYILDINVPKLNGLDTLQNIRKTSTTPAIFLTSYKDKETLKNGFLNGADDFLTKPCDMDELHLRIQSILKRSGKIIDIIKIEDIEYNPILNIIKKNDIEIHLGSKVIELFKLFYENQGKIITKDMIHNRLWDYDEQFSEGSLRVYITKIQKLFKNKKITNIKNVGYKFEF